METRVLKVDGPICQWIDGPARPPNSAPAPLQPGILRTLLRKCPPKNLTASNLFLRTTRFSMSQADRQDPEKGNVIGMFSAALLCHSQIH